MVNALQTVGQLIEFLLMEICLRWLVVFGGGSDTDLRVIFFPFFRFASSKKWGDVYA